MEENAVEVSALQESCGDAHAEILPKVVDDDAHAYPEVSDRSWLYTSRSDICHSPSKNVASA